MLPFDNYTYNESKIVKESVSIWATSSNKLHEFTTNKQIRYIHAIQPNQYLPESKVITSKELTILKDNKHKKNIKKYYGSLNPNMLKAKYVSDLRYLFKDNNVTLYRDSCCHLNHLGMGMISKKIIIDHKFVFNSLLKSKGDFNIKLMGKEITKVFNIRIS